MKTTKNNPFKNSFLRKTALVLAIAATSFSCSSDSDSTPEVVNEEEVITTVTATFTPTDGGTAVVLEYRDLDGDGAGDPTVTVSGPFAQNTTYTSYVTFKNELTDPVTDITEEIIEEGVDHQLFYQLTGTLNAMTYANTASNYDDNNLPIGLEAVFTTTGTASGNLVITLRHQPTKTADNVSDGDITNAAGSTDAEVTFAITVE